MDVVTLQAAKADARRYGDVRMRTDRFLPGSVVASGCYGIGLSSSASVAPAQTSTGTSRILHKQLVDACDIRLVFFNAFVNDSPNTGTNQDGPSAYTIKAGIEIGGQGGSGFTYPVTFDGKLSGVVDPGGLLISDPLAIEIAAGTSWYERVNITAAGGTWNPSALVLGTTIGGFVASSDVAHAQTTITNNPAFCYGSGAVLGTPTARNVATALCIGDSMTAGLGDAGDGGGGGVSYAFSLTGLPSGGFVVRALTAANIPWINMAHSSDAFANFNLARGHHRRLAIANGCTHAVCAYGFNDIHVSSASLATLQAAAIPTWGLLTRRGMKVHQTTIPPQTSSTDGWLTVGNQTTVSAPKDTVRQGFNDWLRGGAPMSAGAAVTVGTPGALLAGQAGHPLTGYFEVADTVESARNSGKYRAGQSFSIASAAVVTNVATITTTAPHGLVAGDRVYISGVGAPFDSSGSTMRIISGTPPTTTTFRFALTTADTSVGAGGTVAFPYTFDGTHQNRNGHILMAAGILPAAFTLPASA